MDTNVHRDLGRIDATLDTHGKQMDELNRRQKEMNDRLQAIHDVLTQVGGGWKVLAFVGVVSAAMTTMIFKVWSLLRLDG